jgi:hypothetical protein
MCYYFENTISLELAALCGNYVNYGVFELYGDRALADALDISLKMTLSIPLSDIMSYRKVCIKFCLLFALDHCFIIDIKY